jgi:hypothetical protein
VPAQALFVRTATPLAPETQYTVTVTGVRNLVGLVGGGTVPLRTPKAAPPPPPPAAAPADTGRAAPRPPAPPPSAPPSAPPAPRPATSPQPVAALPRGAGQPPNRGSYPSF